MKKRRSHQKGFTLIELIIILAIITILSAVIIPRMGSLVAKSRDKIRRGSMANLARVLDQYKIENGQYPLAVAGNYSEQDPLGASYTPPNPWISGLTPTYFRELPTDPSKGRGTVNPDCAALGWKSSFFYVTDATGRNYKLVARCIEAVELVASDPFYDPARPTYAWAVTNNPSATAAW